MTQSRSPFRLLSKTYSNQILTRDQYVLIRTHLLKKLQSDGSVTEEDLKKMTDIAQGKSTEDVEKSYSSSDWMVISLGLIAAIVLAFVLYN